MRGKGEGRKRHLGLGMRDGDDVDVVGVDDDVHGGVGVDVAEGKAADGLR